MVMPIESITPYNPKITIKARVIFKSEIRSWDKPTGSGSLFSIDMQDQSGKIRLTCFKKKVDEYFKKVEIGKVYVIRFCCCLLENLSNYIFPFLATAL